MFLHKSVVIYVLTILFKITCEQMFVLYYVKTILKVANQQ